MYTRFSRRYNYQHARIEDPEVIKELFNRVPAVIAEFGILPEDIFNHDETGFAMGVISTTKVVTSSEKSGRLSLIQPGNRVLVTLIECIRSNGEARPQPLIFEGKARIQAWYEDYSIPPD